METVTIINGKFIVNEQDCIAPNKIYIDPENKLHEFVIKGRPIKKFLIVNSDMTNHWACPLLDDGAENFVEKLLGGNVRQIYEFHIYQVVDDGSNRGSNLYNKEVLKSDSYKDFMKVYDIHDDDMDGVRQIDYSYYSDSDDRMFILTMDEYGFEEIIFCILDESILEEFEMEEEEIQNLLHEVEDEQDDDLAEIRYATLIRNIRER